MSDFWIIMLVLILWICVGCVIESVALSRSRPRSRPDYKRIAKLEAELLDGKDYCGPNDAVAQIMKAAYMPGTVTRSRFRQQSGSDHAHLPGVE